VKIRRVIILVLTIALLISTTSAVSQTCESIDLTVDLLILGYGVEETRFTEFQNQIDDATRKSTECKVDLNITSIGNKELPKEGAEFEGKTHEYGEFEKEGYWYLENGGINQILSESLYYIEKEGYGLKGPREGRFDYDGILIYGTPQFEMGGVEGEDPHLGQTMYVERELDESLNSDESLNVELNTAVHELGHFLSLRHSCTEEPCDYSGSIMDVDLREGENASEDRIASFSECNIESLEERVQPLFKESKDRNSREKRYPTFPRKQADGYLKLANPVCNNGYKNEVRTVDSPSLCETSECPDELSPENLQNFYTSFDDPYLEGAGTDITGIGFEVVDEDLLSVIKVEEPPEHGFWFNVMLSVDGDAENNRTYREEQKDQVLSFKSNVKKNQVPVYEDEIGGKQIGEASIERISGNEYALMINIDFEKDKTSVSIQTDDEKEIFSALGDVVYFVPINENREDEFWPVSDGYSSLWLPEKVNVGGDKDCSWVKRENQLSSNFVDGKKVKNCVQRSFESDPELVTKNVEKCGSQEIVNKSGCFENKTGSEERNLSEEASPDSNESISSGERKAKLEEGDEEDSKSLITQLLNLIGF
jgi:hypothetical protein